jgi:hypothetical protein
MPQAPHHHTFMDFKEFGHFVFVFASDFKGILSSQFLKPHAHSTTAFSFAETEGAATNCKFVFPGPSTQICDAQPTFLSRLPLIEQPLHPPPTHTHTCNKNVYTSVLLEFGCSHLFDF